MISYLVCATPRSGSTLLCGLLKATGVAGNPESYFREPDETSWARRFGMLDDGGSLDYHAFAAAAVNAGTTSNGVFGARMMWGTLEEVAAKLDDTSTGDPVADLRVLNQTFGNPLFVHLWRHDTVAQAVSWLRAEQTGFWHHGEPPGRGGRPRYDGPRLRGFVRMVEDHNAAWRSWFAAAGVAPHSVRYEDLIADVDGVTGALLDFLGIVAPPGHRTVPRHQRQADQMNAEWIARYHAEFPGELPTDRSGVPVDPLDWSSP